MPSPSLLAAPATKTEKPYTPNVGTAFFILGTRYAVTNAHVLANCKDPGLENAEVAPRLRRLCRFVTGALLPMEVHKGREKS